MWSLRFSYRLWKWKNRDFNARKWSNDELRKFASLFTGNIINVSAAKDADKENDFYRNYFTNSHSFTISNYMKEINKDNTYNEVVIDLNNPIPNDSELISKFDAVFTHTVLEHVYNINTAIDNLCRLSKDVVITIVPFLQTFHHEESIYHDYWRMSPYTLIRLFNEKSFKTLYISWNNDPIGNIYIFHISSRNPEKWVNIKTKMGVINTYGPGYNRQTLLSNTKVCPGVTINTLNDFI